MIRVFTISDGLAATAAANPVAIELIKWSSKPSSNDGSILSALCDRKQETEIKLYKIWKISYTAQIKANNDTAEAKKKTKTRIVTDSTLIVSHGDCWHKIFVLSMLIEVGVPAL